MNKRKELVPREYKEDNIISIIEEIIIDIKKLESSSDDDGLDFEGLFIDESEI